MRCFVVRFVRSCQRSERRLVIMNSSSHERSSALCSACLLRKRGIKGSSVRCSRRACCLRRWYARCFACSVAFSCCFGLCTVAAAVHCTRVAALSLVAVQSLQPVLHSLRGGHRSLGVVVAATAELCVRPAGLRLLTVHVSRASTKGLLASVKTLDFFDLPKTRAC